MWPLKQEESGRGDSELPQYGIEGNIKFFERTKMILQESVTRKTVLVVSYSNLQRIGL